MLKLQEYLEKSGVTQTFFFEKLGISRFWFYKILKKGQIPDLELAIRIEEATKGKVSVYDWVEDKHKICKNKKNKKTSQKQKED